MKKLAVLLCLLVSFTSCQKIQEYYNSLNNNETPDCQITKIESASGNSIATIFYHDDGRPGYVNTNYVEDGVEYSESHPYFYDELKRLIQIGEITTAHPSNRTFAYEGNSRLPVRDTVHIVTHMTVSDYDYDQKGRLIRVYLRTINLLDEGGIDSPDTEYRYYYDIRGNRQEHPSNPTYKGLIEYTTKPSIYSLHPVWQLQHQNYSRNSTVEAETYNSSGLPLVMGDNNREHRQLFYNMGDGSKQEYICK